MSNALSHPSSHARPRREGRPLPVGFGLLIAAVVSIGLWVGVIQLAGRLLG